MAESPERKASMASLVGRLAALVAFFLPLIGGLLFGIAGTFDYPGAWILLLTFFLVALAMSLRYLRSDPDFLRNRMDYREREKPQRRIIGLSFFPFLAVFVVPPLDLRLGWTPFSWPLVIGGEALFLISYAALAAVFKANR